MRQPGRENWSKLPLPSVTRAHLVAIRRCIGIIASRIANGTRVPRGGERCVPLSVPAVLVPEVIVGDRGVRRVLLVRVGPERELGGQRPRPAHEPSLLEIRLSELDHRPTGNAQPAARQLVAQVPRVCDFPWLRNR